MTRDEAKMLILTMEATYPNYHPMDTTFTVNTWAAMLGEYDFAKVQVAFKKYVLSDTSGFAPSIGQLVAQMQDIAEGDDLGELEVWSLVSKAIGNSLYHSDEEFAKLPPVVQRAVHSAANLKEWAEMDSDTVRSVVQSHLIRNYRAAAKAMRDEAKLPPGFREVLDSIKSTPDRLVTQNPRPVDPPQLLEGHKDELTDEQIEKRRKQLEEVRRSLNAI